ncbi:MAG: alpha/beta fold hydrolase [Azoarcus sp.]|jgi:pyochelin biosynthetic protein PchC|nr:alpha/beta fold hydrolase [Azoarcus sp.]
MYREKSSLFPVRTSPCQAQWRLNEQKPTWLRPYTRSAGRTDKRAVLICFPHAGGAASAFVGWRELVPDNWGLFAVKYPGREDRLAEAHASSVTAIAEAVAAELRVLVPASVPMIFFGHSMGAVVAYETAHVLSRSGRAPGLLAVSASSPEGDSWFSSPDTPGTSNDGKSHQRFIAERVAGLDPDFSEIAKYPDLRDYAVAVVQADIDVCDQHSLTPDTLVSVPILALSGQDDPATTPGNVDKWRAYSTGPFSALSFPGGHFYLRNEAKRVVQTLVKTADPYLAPPMVTTMRYQTGGATGGCRYRADGGRLPG